MLNKEKIITLEKKLKAITDGFEFFETRDYSMKARLYVLEESAEGKRKTLFKSETVFDQIDDDVEGFEALLNCLVHDFDDVMNMEFEDSWGDSCLLCAYSTDENDTITRLCLATEEYITANN